MKLPFLLERALKSKDKIRNPIDLDVMWFVFWAFIICAVVGSIIAGIIDGVQTDAKKCHQYYNGEYSSLVVGGSSGEMVGFNACENKYGERKEVPQKKDWIRFLEEQRKKNESAKS